MKSAGDKAKGHHQTYELYLIMYKKQMSFIQKEMDKQEKGATMAEQNSGVQM